MHKHPQRHMFSSDGVHQEQTLTDLFPTREKFVSSDSLVSSVLFLISLSIPSVFPPLILFDLFRFPSFVLCFSSLSRILPLLFLSSTYSPLLFPFLLLSFPLPFILSVLLPILLLPLPGFLIHPLLVPFSLSYIPPPSPLPVSRAPPPSISTSLPRKLFELFSFAMLQNPSGVSPGECRT